jgi:decaprenylphospho-beta-D-erythro-pentofuranosid-2-ulose 2-reductase
VENAFGEPQTILLLGGTSDIGLAIVRKLVSPTLRHVVLAVRSPEKADPIASELRTADVAVTTVQFDAAATHTHAAMIDKIVAEVGDLDVVIMSFGVLGDQAQFDTDPGAAADAVQVNYTGSVSVGLAVAAQLRSQGHGRLVVLSSVAGERVRKDNFVYGSSKAGLDGFAQGLGDSLEGTGVKVLVVRPGFVHSAMTSGRQPAPFATTPEAVADATVEGLRKGRRTVWVPGVLRYVFSLLRHVPGPIFRRLPLG